MNRNPIDGKNCDDIINQFIEMFEPESFTKRIVEFSLNLYLIL